MATDFLPLQGHYRKLVVYQKAESIYDITYHFAHTFLEKGDRTIDQMVQAARSGKQNIAEGSQAATTSRETEIKLYNVAKASLHELLVDYEDYLRVRDLDAWPKDSPKAGKTRAVCRAHPESDFYRERIETLQQAFAHYEQIKRFTLLPEPFSMERGELTNTLKLRRPIVAEHYQEVINQMYEE